MRRPGRVRGMDLGCPPGHVARHRLWIVRRRSALMGAWWWIRTAVLVLVIGTVCGVGTTLLVYLAGLLLIGAFR